MTDDRGDQKRTAERGDGVDAGDIAGFYDALTPYYHLIYQDWPASIERQGHQLDALIRERWGDRMRDVLDAACGIGTQTFALATRGYRMTSGDISSAAITRARAEAERRRLDVTFVEDDMRSLGKVAGQSFDLVIACDNAIPHLASDAEIRTTFETFRERLRPGGGCAISVRDYADLEREGVRLVPFGVRRDGSTRFVVFQVWEFDPAGYDLNFYFLEDRDDAEPITHVMRSRYHAVTTDRLVQLMREAGFDDVERIDGRFFQPLIVGTKPAASLRGVES
jgi:SAM-dependent methyltransferase